MIPHHAAQFGVDPTPETGDRPVTLDAEQAFLGCLMHCPAPHARRLLAGIRADDAAHPPAHATLHLVMAAVVADIPPSPVVLLPAARNRGWLDTEHKHKLYAHWLIDTYRCAPYPETGPMLKVELLELALRQAIREHATRLLDIVAHSDLDRVQDWATLDTDRILDLRQRHADALAATKITPATPRTGRTGPLSAASQAAGNHSPQPDVGRGMSVAHLHTLDAAAGDTP